MNTILIILIDLGGFETLGGISILALRTGCFKGLGTLSLLPLSVSFTYYYRTLYLQVELFGFDSYLILFSGTFCCYLGGFWCSNAILVASIGKNSSMMLH